MRSLIYQAALSLATLPAMGLSASVGGWAAWAYLVWPVATGYVVTSKMDPRP